MEESFGTRSSSYSSYTASSRTEVQSKEQRSRSQSTSEAYNQFSSSSSSTSSSVGALDENNGSKAILQNHSTFSTPTSFSKKFSRSPNSSGLSNPVNFSKYTPAVEKALLWKVISEKNGVASLMLEEEASIDAQVQKNRWERLHLLNNPVVVDRRRTLESEYRRLCLMEQEIVSGGFKKTLLKEQEKKEKIRSLYDSDGVFNRLYRSAKSSSGTKKSPPSRTSGVPPKKKLSTVQKSGDTFNTLHPTSSKEELTPCTRLYELGVSSLKAKAYRAELIQRQREKEEMKKYFCELLSVKRRAEDYSIQNQKKREKKQKEIEEKAEYYCLNPNKAKEYLLKKSASSEKEKAFFTLLSKRGFLTKQVLDERKKAKELNECTFQPAVNSYKSSLGGAFDDQVKAFAEKKKCWKEDVIRQRKLAILSSKMKGDHHFRARVERDPEVGEAFMRSLVV